jgi:hypothetical protein
VNCEAILDSARAMQRFSWMVRVLVRREIFENVVGSIWVEGAFLLNIYVLGERTIRTI